MTNEVIEINPPTATFALSTRGSNFDWAWFATFCLILLILLGSVFGVNKHQRTFHRIGILVVFITAICYFIMASNLGSTPIQVQFRRTFTGTTRGVVNGIPTRAIWCVRWIMYTLIFPLIIFMLLLATGRPISEYITTCFFAIVWSVTWLIGALTASSYKWGFFTFGMVGMFLAMWELLMPARRSAARLGGEHSSAYLIPASILCAVWLIYPVAWGLGEGGNVIRPTSEMVFYGILDMCIIVLVVCIFLAMISSVDHSVYGANRWGKNDQDPLWEKGPRGRESAPTSSATHTSRSAGNTAPAAPATTTTATTANSVGGPGNVAPPLEGQQAVTQ